MTTSEEFIPVSRPSLDGAELNYVQECLVSTWISSRGSYIDRFEEEFARFCGTNNAIACNTGTAALHLTLLSLDVGPGDEVIVPTLTYIATANAVRYCGATPVFVDSLPGAWNLDPDGVRAAITSQTKAIIAVHLYGEPADMEQLVAIAGESAVTLIEDAAQAHGARVDGKPAGSLGTIA